MIKCLQGRAGSLARGWQQRRGRGSTGFPPPRRLKRARAHAHSSAVPGVLGRCSSAGIERDSPGAQVPPLPGARLSSCGGLSPVPVHSNTALWQTRCGLHQETPLPFFSSPCLSLQLLMLKVQAVVVKDKAFEEFTLSQHPPLHWLEGFSSSSLGLGKLQDSPFPFNLTQFQPLQKPYLYTLCFWSTRRDPFPSLGFPSQR